MELWIRSQDKTFLVKADNVVIDNNGLSLYTHANKDCNDITYELGTYKTKERALEVLDELQDFISGRKIMDRMNILGGNMNNVFPTMTFIMPEE